MPRGAYPHLAARPSQSQPVLSHLPRGDTRKCTHQVCYTAGLIRGVNAATLHPSTKHPGVKWAIFVHAVIGRRPSHTRTLRLSAAGANSWMRAKMPCHRMPRGLDTQKTMGMGPGISSRTRSSTASRTHPPHTDGRTQAAHHAHTGCPTLCHTHCGPL